MDTDVVGGGHVASTGATSFGQGIADGIGNDGRGEGDFFRVGKGPFDDDAAMAAIQQRRSELVGQTGRDRVEDAAGGVLLD